MDHRFTIFIMKIVREIVNAVSFHVLTKKYFQSTNDWMNGSLKSEWTCLALSSLRKIRKAILR